MAIDKKIKYNDQRLTKDQQEKIKPVVQAGTKNFLGKQEMVTVPKKWLSSSDHVVAELAYITPREQKILIDKNLYGSLKGKPNIGPGGIMSLQGGDSGGLGGDGPSGNGDGPSARDRAMGLQGKTGKADKSLGVGGDGVDRSKVNQFSEYGKNRFNKNLNPTTKTNKFGGILSGLLGLINPAFGLLSKGLGYLGSKVGDLRGYNEDGTPRTQAEYEAMVADRKVQGRINNMTDRMLAGKTFSQTNLDNLMGMTDRFGKSFGTNLGNIDNVRGSNLRGVLNSSVPSGIAPMGVNVPTGIETIDVDLPGNDLMAGLTKMQKKGLDAKKNAVGMGLFSPQDALDSISPFNDPDDPATLNEVKEYYGIV